MIYSRKRAPLEGVFEHGGKKAPAIDEEQVKELHAKIGELAVANDFFHESSNRGSASDAKMIAPANANLPIGKQCKQLSISRSSFCHQPKGEAALNLMLMSQIDEQFLVIRHLHNESHLVTEKRIRRLRRLMPDYQKLNTSRAAKGHKTYPYLLRGLRVDRPNQVLGRRHHLSADEARVPVLGRNHGLAHA